MFRWNRGSEGICNYVKKHASDLIPRNRPIGSIGDDRDYH